MADNRTTTTTATTTTTTPRRTPVLTGAAPSAGAMPGTPGYYANQSSFAEYQAAGSMAPGQSGGILWVGDPFGTRNVIMGPHAQPFAQHFLPPLPGMLTDEDRRQIRGEGFIFGHRRTMTMNQAISELDRMDEDQIYLMQVRLWNAGLYDPGMYKNNTPPAWGVIDSTTYDAYRSLLSVASWESARGKDINAVLEELTAANAASIEALMSSGQAGGLQDVEQIVTSDPEAVGRLVDQVAKATRGRKLSPEQRQQIVDSIIGKERSEQQKGISARQAAHEHNAAAQGGGQHHPTGGQGRVTGNFGEDRGTHRHGGIDLAVPVGTPVLAPVSGTVSIVQEKGNAGRQLWIKGDDGNTYVFFHLDGWDVKVGERVNPGQQVARSGNTGRSTGPHLHFEVHAANGAKLNPAPFLRQTVGQATAQGPAATQIVTVEAQRVDPQAQAEAAVEEIDPVGTAAYGASKQYGQFLSIIGGTI